MKRRTKGIIVYVVCVVAAPFASIALAVRGMPFPWHYVVGLAILGIGAIVARVLARPRVDESSKP